MLVDLRERAEWDAGHLKVAKLLPLSGLEEMKAEELARKYDVRPLEPGCKDLLKAGFERAPR